MCQVFQLSTHSRVPGGQNLYDQKQNTVRHFDQTSGVFDFATFAGSLHVGSRFSGVVLGVLSGKPITPLTDLIEKPNLDRPAKPRWSDCVTRALHH